MYVHAHVSARIVWLVLHPVICDLLLFDYLSSNFVGDCHGTNRFIFNGCLQ